MKTPLSLFQGKAVMSLIQMASSCKVPAPVITSYLPVVTKAEVDHQGGVEAEAGDKVEDKAWDKVGDKAGEEVDPKATGEVG